MHLQMKPEGGGEDGEQTSFILDPEAKARIMQGEARLQKQHSVQASAINVITQLPCVAWLIITNHQTVAAFVSALVPCSLRDSAPTACARGYTADSRHCTMRHPQEGLSHTEAVVLHHSPWASLAIDAPLLQHTCSARHS